MPSWRVTPYPLCRFSISRKTHATLSHCARAQNRSLAQQAIVDLRRIPEVQARERRRCILAELRDRVAAGELRRFDLLPEDAVREDRDR